MWTKTAPKEPGYYWWRDAMSSKSEIAEIFDHGKFQLIGIDDVYHQRGTGGEWWPTPIQQPTEPK